MSKSAEKVITQITFEVSQIDQLFAVYTDLLDRVQQGTPNTTEIAAAASVLHSFYNGVENIFLSVAKGLDQSVPSGSQSHRDLLLQMIRATTNRTAVVSKETANMLADYLGFRHFFRHSFSFFID